MILKISKDNFNIEELSIEEKGLYGKENVLLLTRGVNYFLESPEERKNIFNSFPNERELIILIPQKIDKIAVLVDNEKSKTTEWEKQSLKEAENRHTKIIYKRSF